MRDTLHIDAALVPWLVAPALLVVVIATALTGPALVGLIGVILALTLGHLGLPAYYRHTQERVNRNDRAR